MKALEKAKRNEPARLWSLCPAGRLRLSVEDACSAEMLVLIRWHDRTMAGPLSQLVAVKPDQSTAEAIGDWHYWVAQGYCF